MFPSDSVSVFCILAKDKEALHPKKHLFSEVNLENISDE